MAGTVAHVNSATWDSEVTSSSLPVLVDFWAEWCGPCRAIAPILEELSVEMAGRIKIVKVNVDEAHELAQRFNIRSIPTLLLFRGGQVAGQMVGAMPKAALKSKIEGILAS
jgi:thioredoxin 1